LPNGEFAHLVWANSGPYFKGIQIRWINGLGYVHNISGYPISRTLSRGTGSGFPNATSGQKVCYWTHLTKYYFPMTNHGAQYINTNSPTFPIGCKYFTTSNTGQNSCYHHGYCMVSGSDCIPRFDTTSLSYGWCANVDESWHQCSGAKNQFGGCIGSIGVNPDWRWMTESIDQETGFYDFENSCGVTSPATSFLVP